MALSQINLYQQLTSCRVVSSSNIAGSYYNGQSNNGVGATLTVTATGQLTIDDVEVNNGDRVLLQAQTAALQNGIYVVNNNGSAGDNPVLQRSADFQNIEQMKAGQYLTVNAGTAHAGELYVLIEPLPTVLGASSIIFETASSSASGTYLEVANNLSDVANAATARTNLGLGTAATASASTFQTVASIKAGITSASTGGNAFESFTVTGLTPSSIVVAQMRAAGSNPDVYIVSTGTNNNLLSVQFSGDPGTGATLYYIAFLAGAQ